MPSFSLPANHLLAPGPLQALQSPVQDASECSRSEQRNVAGKIVRRLLLALPAIWLGYLMFKYAVDVPFGDQWDGIATLFVKMRAGTLGFSDFFAFHNEHRIFFPRLLIFPLAKLTNWNVRAEVALIWVLACLCALNVWRLARSTASDTTQSRWWLLFFANVLLFTPMQWENVLWGFQVGFFLPLVAMTALPWAACGPSRKGNFAVTMALCLISTFSIASGFCSWLLCAPLLFFLGEKGKARDEMVAWGIWIGAAFASVLIYFHGYKGPELHPNQLEVLQQPGPACQFIVAYLGNPFGNGTEIDHQVVALVAGAILLTALAAAAIYVWRWRKDRVLVAQTLPWMALSSITLCNGVLTMFGRLGYGVGGALQSRYISFAVLLPVALLFLGARIQQHWRNRNVATADKLRLGLVSLGAAFALLFFLGSVQSLKTWHSFQHDRLTAKAVLALRGLVDEPPAIAHFLHRVPGVREWADTVESLGYLRPARLTSPHVREIAESDGEIKAGGVQRVARGNDGRMGLSGWAILPLKQRIADSVILAYDKGDGDPIIFARANVRLPKDDVATKLGDPVYRNSGWEHVWKRSELPDDAKQVSAWAFDAESCRAYEIGSIQL
ncbi:MAG: hypothetical protein ACJ8NS_12545 [Chthoniobacterales bacterium]